MANARLRPRMSPSFAPSNMNAAMTSVYSVIAVCTPWIVVSRSSTICEIATFMTLESSTMMNWAEARMTIGNHLRTAELPVQSRVVSESIATVIARMSGVSSPAAMSTP